MQIQCQMCVSFSVICSSCVDASRGMKC